MVNISIGIKIPDNKKDKDYINLEDKVKDYIKFTEKDSDCQHHYEYLTHIYKKLKSCPCVPEEYAEVFGLLDEFFGKANSVASGDRFMDMDGADFFKHGDKR